MDNTKLTTVKILTEWYRKFKIHSFDTGFSLQKLVNRSLYRFVTDEKFREDLVNYEIPDEETKKF